MSCSDAGLLAPVSAGIDRPNSLLLVWMPGFDLVRVTGTPPVIRIDGRDAATGRLPGGSWTGGTQGPPNEAGPDLDARWTSGRLAWLMRVVITVMPVFRRWPTRYRCWRAAVQLAPVPEMTSRWERTVSDAGQSYRHATGS